MKTLRAYLATLTPTEQADYAVRAGTTINYLRKALSKGQRFDGALVRQLNLLSNGAVGLTDLRPDIWPAHACAETAAQSAASSTPEPRAPVADPDVGRVVPMEGA